MHPRPDVAQLLADHPVIDGHNDLLWTARVAAAYDFDRLDVGAGVVHLLRRRLIALQQESAIEETGRRHHVRRAPS